MTSLPRTWRPARHQLDAPEPRARSHGHQQQRVAGGSTGLALAPGLLRRSAAAQGPARHHLRPRPSGRLARAQAAGRRADQALWKSSLALLALAGAALLLASPPARWPLPGTWPTPGDAAAALWQLVALGAMGLVLPALWVAATVMAPRPGPPGGAGRAPARPAQAAWLVGAAAAAACLGSLWVAAGSGA